MEKLCIFCEYLEYEAAGVGDYAEPASLYCKKKHELLSRSVGFCHSQSVYDIKDFRRMIKTAEKCADYKPPNAKVSGSRQLHRPESA